MADISEEIKAFKDADYGEDVRDGFISLAEKVNAEVEKGTETIKDYEAAEGSRVEAEKQREAAETKREEDSANAVKKANDAADRANKAAESVENASGVLNDNEISTATTYSSKKIEDTFIKGITPITSEEIDALETEA